MWSRLSNHHLDEVPQPYSAADKDPSDVAGKGRDTAGNGTHHVHDDKTVPTPPAMRPAAVSFVTGFQRMTPLWKRKVGKNLPTLNDLGELPFL